MKKSYQHLTRDDRSQIYAYKSSGLPNSRIAEKLSVDRRTIDREIKRNSGQCGYRFQQSHAKAVQRCKAASSGSCKLVHSLWEKIGGGFFAGDGVRSRLVAAISLKGFPESAEPGSAITFGSTGSGAETCISFCASGGGRTGAAAGT